MVPARLVVRSLITQMALYIEDGWNVLHIIADLVKGVLRIDLILGWAFQLHEYQGQTIDKQNNIRPAIVSVLDICKLVDHIKAVVGNGLIVQ